MNEPIWLSEKLVVAIHWDQIVTHGGLDGLRDANLLDASLARPRHLWTYAHPDLFELAAAYGYGLTKNHPFIDGNKRTAFMVMYVFLGLNGYFIDAQETEVVLTMEQLASSILTQDDLGIWLKKHSKPRSL
ncbi:death-on-curing protein [Hydrococcus rivularis NIES-593]|uniref:Death-on-curing protein n=1 Tax=Hydrococcus rivularis NIES-593 TaxID=1921803 RepID=A0A1U7HR19_9CYAN|nr:type II toxin-antitoxin system death-on-curing family toxin [Hydrococcus rivularis]OKH25975.1 death-on-curing protein [Hydrococcus rivularis NIES-593]